jgi:hypothetical protein
MNIKFNSTISLYTNESKEIERYWFIHNKALNEIDRFPIPFVKLTDINGKSLSILCEDSTNAIYRFDEDFLCIVVYYCYVNNDGNSVHRFVAFKYDYSPNAFFKDHITFDESTSFELDSTNNEFKVQNLHTKYMMSFYTHDIAKFPNTILLNIKDFSDIEFPNLVMFDGLFKVDGYMILRSTNFKNFYIYNISTKVTKDITNKVNVNLALDADYFTDNFKNLIS